jgi:aerobic carbon-monoxide dehydrogenase large subunit
MTETLEKKIDWIGQSPRRREDFRLMTGTAKYVDDFQEFEGQTVLVMGVVRSPYAHARIINIDTAPVKALAGVLAVHTGKGIGNEFPLMMTIPVPNLKVPPRHPLAEDIVRYVGDPVAVILAENKTVLTDALDLLASNIEYEPLDTVSDSEQALADGATQLYPEIENNLAFVFQSGGGDVKAAFDEADKVINFRIVNQRLAPAPLEPRACFFAYNPESEQMTAWASTQAIFRVKDVVVRNLKLDPKNVRARVAEVGGGFGSKTGFVGEEIVCAWLAHKYGRAVKWLESRSENMLTNTHGRGQINYISAAVKNDGTLLGINVHTVADLGAWLAGATAMVPTGTPRMLNGVYAMKALTTTVLGSLNNKVPTSAYRGAGRPEAAYVLERTMDRVAMELGLDPAAVRFKNFIPPENFPYNAVTGIQYDSGNYAAALQKALEMLDYEHWRKEQMNRRALINTPEGRFQIGIGISTYLEIAGGGGSAAMGMPAESASVKILPDGKLLVQSAVATNGQGHYTLFAQIAAGILNMPMEMVEVELGDTALPSYAIGTFGSRTTAVAGSAVYLAAEAVKNEVLKAAAKQLEAAEVDLILKDGQISVKGVPSKSLTLLELIEANAVDAETLFNQHRSFDPPGATFPSGAHIAVVEIDFETGDLHILKYVAVDDCGNVVNPFLADGQVHGSLVQGISQALYEEVVYDDNGQLISGTLMDYTLPTADAMPYFDTAFVETPSPHNPLGAKGIGESGCTGAPGAVVNAAINALSPLGVKELDMPLRPEKLWKAVQASRAGELTTNGGIVAYVKPPLFAKLGGQATDAGGKYVFE